MQHLEIPSNKYKKNKLIAPWLRNLSISLVLIICIITVVTSTYMASVHSVYNKDFDTHAEYLGVYLTKEDQLLEENIAYLETYLETREEFSVSIVRNGVKISDFDFLDNITFEYEALINNTKFKKTTDREEIYENLDFLYNSILAYKKAVSNTDLIVGNNTQNYLKEVYDNKNNFDSLFSDFRKKVSSDLIEEASDNNIFK